MKKNVIISILIILISSAVYSQNYEILMARADSMYKVKAYSQAFELSKRSFILGDTNYEDLYNGARFAYLAGRNEETFNLLDSSYKYKISSNDYQFCQKDIDELQADSVLINLHADKKWTVLVAKLQKTNDNIEANLDKPLTAELNKMYDNLLSMNVCGKPGRKPRMDSLEKKIRFYDSIYIIRVTQILDTKGWLGKDKIGLNGNNTLFRVMCSAPPKIQEKYKQVMFKALQNKTIKPFQYAWIEDEYELNEGRKQIYGTIFRPAPTTHRFYIASLEDPDAVDYRRASIGLGPMAIYTLQNLGFTWNVEEYKKQLPQIIKWEELIYGPLIVQDTN